MIFDSKSLSTKEPDWDDHIVVAGSGPVGIFTAIWLGRNGIKVLLIPGKDASLSEDRNAKKRILFQKGSPKIRKELGGNSRYWGGRFFRFDRNDFNVRSWVSNEKWPITFCELESLYFECEEILGLPHFWNMENMGQSKKAGFDFDGLNFNTELFESWLIINNFSEIFYEEIEKSSYIKVAAHASIVSIAITNFRVSTLTVADSNDSLVTIAPARIILAMGAVENARYLLLTAARFPKYFGEVSKNIGKYFMIHFIGSFPNIRLPNDLDFRFYRTKLFQFRRTIQLTPDRQKMLGIANAMATFSLDDLNNIGLSGIWARLKQGYTRYGFGMLKRLFKVALNYKNGTRKSSASNTAIPHLFIWTEHLPNYNSQISLSSECDQFGNPLAQSKISHTKIDEKTFYESVREIESYLGRFSAQTPAEAQRKTQFSSKFEDYFAEVHPMGGSRMGLTPKDGVVDAYSQVFGIEGLYVTGTSTFVTGSHAAPTLTALAVALKCVKKISEKVLESSR